MIYKSNCTILVSGPPLQSVSGVAGWGVFIKLAGTLVGVEVSYGKGKGDLNRIGPWKGIYRGGSVRGVVAGADTWKPGLVAVNRGGSGRGQWSCSGILLLYQSKWRFCEHLARETIAKPL